MLRGWRAVGAWLVAASACLGCGADGKSTAQPWLVGQWERLHGMVGADLEAAERLLPEGDVEGWRAVADAQPESSHARMRYAFALLAAGDAASAVTAFEHALQLDPNNEVAIVGLGRVVADRDGAEAELQVYRDLAARYPRSGAAHKRIALILAERGDADEAIAACRAALELHADDTVTWHTLRGLLRKAGRWAEAEAAAHEHLGADPAESARYLADVDAYTARLELLRGMRLLAEGQPDQAYVAFRNAAAVRPEQPPHPYIEEWWMQHPTALLDMRPDRVFAFFLDYAMLLSHLAASVPDPAVIRDALADGAYVDDMHPAYCTTPLHEAASHAYGDVVRVLLEAGADPLRRDRNGWDVITRAVRSGDRAYVERLLALGVPWTAGEAVVGAAARNDPALMRLVLSRAAGPIPQDSLDDALERAVILGNDRIVPILLDRGARADASSFDRVTYGRTPMLHKALTLGHAEIAARLLEEQVPLAAPDHMGGETALHAAVDARLARHQGEPVAIEFVDRLIARGANVNAADVAGLTPLHAAARGGTPHTVEHLLRRGADVDARGLGDVTPLYYAAGSGGDPQRTVAVLRLLHAHGAALTIRTTADDLTGTPGGRTPVHAAAATGNTRAIEWLVSAGLHPEVPDDDGATPLTLAARGGHADAVRLLLAYGADPTGGQAGGCPLWQQTLAHMFSAELRLRRGRTSLLPGQPDSPTTWRSPYTDAYGQVLDALLAWGAAPAPNACDRFAPLGVPSDPWPADEALALPIVRSVASPTPESDLPRSPYVAARRAARFGPDFLGSPPQVEAALPQAADVSWTAADILRRVAHAGGRVDVADSRGRTPLHHAAALLSPAAVRALLERGADPTAQDAVGRTPLHYAVRTARADRRIVDALLAAGAHPATPDYREATPLHAAAAAARFMNADATAARAAAVLMAAGADPAARDALGRTPWDVLAGCDCPQTAAVLQHAPAGTTVSTYAARRPNPRAGLFRPVSPQVGNEAVDEAEDD